MVLDWGMIISRSRIHGVGFDALATRLQRRDLDVAALCDRARAVFLLQSIKSRAHHVVRIRRTLALGDDVMHAERFENRAHWAAGDNAGAGGRRAQHDLAGAMTASHIVMERWGRAAVPHGPAPLC